VAVLQTEATRRVSWAQKMFSQLGMYGAYSGGFCSR